MFSAVTFDLTFDSKIYVFISCLIADQDYFQYIKKHETLTGNPPIRIYVNKVENRITFKIKSERYLIFIY